MAPAAVAVRQDSADGLLEGTASHRAYLERNPFHPGVFGDLCERAAEFGGLEPLVEYYRVRLAAGGPEASSARVLLTRLLMMRTDYEQALEVSAGVEAQGVEGLLLVGDLRLRAGEREGAAKLFNGALEAAGSRDERGRILRRLCEVFTGTGDAAGLARAAAALGELDPSDHALQREAAELLEIGELIPEAVQAYRRALELVPDDVPRRAQTLADMGACHEQLYEGDQALECYSQALELLHFEHWLALDLGKRRLALHRTGGTLEVLATELGAAAQSPGAGVGPWIQLAELEVARYRADAAVEALLAGQKVEPGHTRLSDLLVQVAEAAGRMDLQRDELGRRVAERPADLGLRLRLVRSLQRGGEGGEARALMDTLTRKAADQPEWASALATGWLELGDDARALAVMDSAIERDGTIEMILQRARLAVETGDVEGALRGLEAARFEASEDLIALATLQLELGAWEAARERLVQAAEANRDEPDALLQLAGLLTDRGDMAGARSALRSAMEVSPRREQHLLATRLARLLRADVQRDAWCARERARLAAAPDDALPWLVLARVQASSQVEEAIRSYAAYVERMPGDEDALRAWARLLAQAGRVDSALNVLDQLAACGSAARQAALLERLVLLKGARRSREMAPTLQTLVRLVWAQPDSLRRCARMYSDLGDRESAIEVWDRVLQLEPEDSVTARRAAAVLLELDRSGQARVQLIRAWRFADPAERPKIAQDLVAALGEEAEAEVRAMAERALANPFDRGLALLGAQLALRSDLSGTARELADLHLARRPRDGEFLGVRARVQLSAGDTAAAVQTVRLLVEYGAPRDGIVRDLVPPAMSAGGMDAVAALGPFAENPGKLAEELASTGFPLRAVGLLRGAVEAGAPLGEGAARLLAKLHGYVEPPGLAIRAFEQVEGVDGPSVVTTHRLGLLYARTGSVEQALMCARRLESLGAAEPLVASFVRTAKVQDAWEAR